MVTRETSIADGLSGLGLEASEVNVAKLTRFAEILANDAVKYGLLGPNEGDRIVTRHILESAALGTLIDECSTIDVGSGAGLPGIVLACLGLPVTLLDSQERRVRFLDRCVRDLEIDAVAIHGRAEDLGRGDLREAFGACCARALAPVPVMLELCLPFVEVGGVLAVLVGADERPEDWARVARILGGDAPRRAEARVPGADLPRSVMIVGKEGPTPDEYPRRSGVPTRRPLG